MSTVSELVVADELVPIYEVADSRGWVLEIVDATTFQLTLPARDGTTFQLYVESDGYPTNPPTWHFQNLVTGVLDDLSDFPKGGGFFHSSGVICAPWNRLAYAPRGPHRDWSIGDWKANPYTKGTKSLAAMALRIAVELRSPEYKGRLR